MPIEFPNLQGPQLLMLQQGRGDLERVRRAAGMKGDEASLRQASQDFEAIFVNLLLKEMRKSLPKDGLFKQSMAREWFEGMLDEAVAKEVSKGPGLGLAAPLLEQMQQAAAKAGKPAAPGALPAPKTEEKKP
ncbi:MAG: hypothetical protein A3J27_15200 [Candidatus Tectomicrobia bacterium RIFCSPLOWO2_12_FULL_69_37]|nr:MAG: hypothetical protein A3J27_15200 [Candidatus Tectomicrobia bacterium RIFCSPLOWO2_12_FULL_69_37]